MSKENSGNTGFNRRTFFKFAGAVGATLAGLKSEYRPAVAQEGISVDTANVPTPEDLQQAITKFTSKLRPTHQNTDLFAALEHNIGGTRRPLQPRHIDMGDASQTSQAIPDLSNLTYKVDLPIVEVSKVDILDHIAWKVMDLYDSASEVALLHKVNGEYVYINDVNALPEEEKKILEALDKAYAKSLRFKEATVKVTKEFYLDMEIDIGEIHPKKITICIDSAGTGASVGGRINRTTGEVTELIEYVSDERGADAEAPHMIWSNLPPESNTLGTLEGKNNRYQLEANSNFFDPIVDGYADDFVIAVESGYFRRLGELSAALSQNPIETDMAYQFSTEYPAFLFTQAMLSRVEVMRKVSQSTMTDDEVYMATIAIVLGRIMNVLQTYNRTYKDAQKNEKLEFTLDKLTQLANERQDAAFSTFADQIRGFYNLIREPRLDFITSVHSSEVGPDRSIASIPFIESQRSKLNRNFGFIVFKETQIHYTSDNSKVVIGSDSLDLPRKSQIEVELSNIYTGELYWADITQYCQFEMHQNSIVVMAPREFTVHGHVLIGDRVRVTVEDPTTRKFIRELDFREMQLAA